VVFYDPADVPDSVREETGARPSALDELLRAADFISVHVPLLPETRHLLDEAAFKAMKPNCIVINTARGPVIDEAALVDALVRGEIAGAGLDVYEREPEVEAGLLESDKVVLAPHIASGSHETRLRMSMMAARNLVAGLKGERPPNLVNGDVWDRLNQ
jgi:glyoxylate reductase